MMRVLFVDDDPLILQGLKRSMFPFRKEFSVSFADRPSQAIALLDAEQFDVVVSDMRMPELDGAALLEIVQQRMPEALRVILSGQTNEEGALRATRVADQFLDKPCNIDVLLGVLRRHAGQASPRVGLTGPLPAPPRLYLDLRTLLESPACSAASVARLLMSSTSVAAKVLQVVNSSFFASSSTVASVEDAVVRLGLRLVESVVLSAGIQASSAVQEAAARRGLAAMDSIGRMGSAAVAAKDRDDALSACLLCDLGIAAFSLAPAWPRFVELNASQSATDAEISVFGVSHAAHGATILGRWNIPAPVVELVARHHEPLDAVWSTMNAVKVACALADDAPLSLEGLPVETWPADVIALLRGGGPDDK